MINKSIVEKLDNILIRYKELETLLSDPEITKDPNKLKDLGKEYRSLDDIVKIWQKYKKTDLEMENISELINSETDKDVIDLAKLEIESLKNTIDEVSNQIKIALLPKDITENADAIMEIRAGAGGDEAGLFAADLFRMYERFAEKERWKYTELIINFSLLHFLLF